MWMRSGRRGCGVLLLSLALNVQGGVVAQPNATNHTPTPAPVPGRPEPPCPKYWEQQASVCVQTCESEGQHRNQRTGQCICGSEDPDVGCPDTLFCNDHQLCEPKSDDASFWFDDTVHQLYVSGGAVALIVLVACVVMHLRDRRRRRDNSEPSEQLWGSE